MALQSKMTVYAAIVGLLALMGGIVYWGSLDIPEIETTEIELQSVEVIQVNTIEKTTLFFHTPEEPSHYWGYVEGKIANHVPGFAVIIEMYNEKESLPRYSQVDVNEDGYYEYKFRVKSVHDGELVWKMEGDYRITIFKVVHLDGRNNFV